VAHATSPTIGTASTATQEKVHIPKRSHRRSDEPRRQLIEGAPRSIKKRHKSKHREQIHHREQRGCLLLLGTIEPPAARRGEDQRPTTAPYLVLPTKSSLARPDPMLGRHLRRTLGARPARAGRRPPSTGMGPHQPERHECEEGMRAQSSPSSSTSRVVLEADTSDGRARGGEEGGGS
jgi:hypothetical protein